jgi:spore maturation protein CgeB
VRIAFFGSSLLSSLWNGAATYYRGILAALHRRGHAITFYEPDAFDRQSHRDLCEPDFCHVVVYPGTRAGAEWALGQVGEADLLVKASGVGVNDALLEEAVAAMGGARRLVVFWDVDAPATLARLEANPDDPLRKQVPAFDLVLTYGGGPPVVRAYQALGARRCVPIYNAVDFSTHHPVAPVGLFAADLSLMANHLPDRSERVQRFFFEPARRLPHRRFLLGGSGWEGVALPDNVRYLGHVYSADHNAFNASALAVLNVVRDSMARVGYSPATRVFEAAGAGACIISDAWEGIEQFLAPGEEVLVASGGDEVAAHLESLTPQRARRIGAAAHRRVRTEHTYEHRAAELDELLGSTQRVVVKRRRAAPPLKVVFLGLSITSSWGNGHATTYRGLSRALLERGHQVTFLERDVAWYRGHRDRPHAPVGKVELYRDLDELAARHGAEVAGADLVVVGSYVPEGRAVGDWVLATARGPVAFYDIDTPITLEALKRDECPYLARAQVPRYDLYFSFTGGTALQQIEWELGSPCARPLYCAVDPELHVPVRVARRWMLGYMGTHSADRLPAVEALLLEPARRLPGERMALAGPGYPDELAWPPNLDRIEHVPPAEHAAFYGGARLTLNLTRQKMRQLGHSPSVRLFEAAACAAPIISDRWPGLEAFFEPGKEILLAEGADEVLAHLEGSPEALAAVGAAARERVLAHHTAAHRAAELEEHVRSLGAWPTQRWA